MYNSSPMKTPIQFTVQLSKDDYIQYLEYFFKHSKEGRRRTRRLYLLGFGVFLLYAGIMRNHELYGVQNMNTYLGHLATTFIVAGVVFALIIKIVRPSLARMSLKTGAGKALLNPVTYHFDEEAIELHNQEGRGRIHLTALKGTEDTEEYIYIHLGGLSAFVLPKAQLNQEDTQAILELLNP